MMSYNGCPRVFDASSSTDSDAIEIFKVVGSRGKGRRYFLPWSGIG